jgi:hypothetical protein
MSADSARGARERVPGPQELEGFLIPVLLDETVDFLDGISGRTG